MICVGIDVAKDKHDCIIVSSEGEVLFKPFVIRVCRPTLSIRYIPIFTEKV